MELISPFIKMDVEVSIIVVNYNTRDLTLECLRSIFCKTIGLTFEVVVVDNASNDDSVDKISLEFPQVKLLESKINLGFGKANNWGFKHSKGKYIFLLNSDTILLNNAIYFLWQFLDKNENISIAGGQLFEKDGITKTHSYSYLFPSILMEIDILFCCYITGIVEKIRKKTLLSAGYYTVAYITGADMMLRRCDIEKYGFFDPCFFLYFEETELSYRFFRNGKKSAFFPEAKIIHLAGGSFSLAKTRSKFYVQGRERYYKLNHNFLYHWTAKIIWNITFIVSVFRNAGDASKRKEWVGRICTILRSKINN